MTEAANPTTSSYHTKRPRRPTAALKRNLSVAYLRVRNGVQCQRRGSEMAPLRAVKGFIVLQMELIHTSAYKD